MLKQFGYAPGNYSAKCCKCKNIVSGLDKRAVTCFDCAEELADKSKNRYCLFGFHSYEKGGGINDFLFDFWNMDDFKAKFKHIRQNNRYQILKFPNLTFLQIDTRDIDPNGLNTIEEMSDEIISQVEGFVNSPMN